MQVVLLGSAFNPLSAVAADCLHESGLLGAVVVPEQAGGRLQGLSAVTFSLLAMGAFRMAHCLLRRLRLKGRGGRYYSLLEWLQAHPGVDVRRTSREALADVLDELTRERDNGAVLSCVFPFWIPVEALRCRFKVNIHPGLLPERKGPNPYFWALAMGDGKAGLTCHELAADFDAGSVLLRHEFEMDPRETEYHLEARTADELKKVLPSFLSNLAGLWDERRPQQGAGEYGKEPSGAVRGQYGRRFLLGAGDLADMLVSLVLFRGKSL